MSSRSKMTIAGAIAESFNVSARVVVHVRLEKLGLYRGPLASETMHGKLAHRRPDMKSPGARTPFRGVRHASRAESTALSPDHLMHSDQH